MYACHTLAELRYENGQLGLPEFSWQVHPSWSQLGSRQHGIHGSRTGYCTGRWGHPPRTSAASGSSDTHTHGSLPHANALQVSLQTSAGRASRVDGSDGREVSLIRRSARCHHHHHRAVPTPHFHGLAGDRLSLGVRRPCRLLWRGGDGSYQVCAINCKRDHL